MRIEQWIYTIPLRLRSWFRRKRVEQELDDELRFHLEREVHEAAARGNAPDEARRRMLRDLRGADEACREARHTNMIDSLIKDMTYAGRTLRRSPIFTATAALTLALGIGASTAIFSVTDAVLLRPLPYPDSNRLALVFWNFRAANVENFLYSNADFFDLRAGTKPIFEDIGGVAGFRAFVTREDGSAEQISKALVTTNFFRLMGARIAFGRDFNSPDGVPQPGEPGVLIPPGSVAILSYEYWQRRYGGSNAVLGQEMRYAGQRGPRIIGVLAPGFKLFFPPAARTDASPDVWVANNIGYDAAHRNLLTVGVIGRLRNGLTLRQAQDQLDALTPEIRKNSFDPTGRLRLKPMQRYLVEEVRPAILALLGAAIFLLLVACANVANLLLVRASLRERELAVRAALGGSWWRLVTQMLAEAVLLSALGTLAGAVLAWLGIRGLLLITPANLPRIESVAMDWRVLLFAALAGLCAVGIFGVAPALRAARPDVIQILGGGGRTAGLGAGHWLRSSAVIAEVALSFVLLVGSGLMLRSFVELRRVNPGYDPHGLLTFFTTRDWPLTRQNGRLELLREIRDRLRALPGVENATEALALPLGGGFRPANSATRPQTTLASAEGADFEQVWPGYFETLRTPVLAGRTFTEDDNAPGRNLVVIDQVLAARAFPNEPAVGKRIHVPNPANPWAEVIGVVAHQRLFSLADRGRETIYFSDGFWGIGVSRYWMLRTGADPAKYAAAVRAEIAKIDRQVVVSKMRPMDVLVDQDQAGTRLSLLLIGIFALIAVLLASVGLYGVLATVVRQRTAEIGVRMAVGATPVSIFKLVIGQGLYLSAVGLAIGLLAALGLTRWMTSMLVEVKPADPSTFAVMTLLFLLVAVLASWVPAARAASLDANTALRDS
ncbi:MAG TPA: ABC transporter permease [Bryobacteraceae bacterium]|jgi:putative ABC transport system permease protein|nr:ABC transporter permease [Bryobacteraceae bacterium]